MPCMVPCPQYHQVIGILQALNENENKKLKSLVNIYIIIKAMCLKYEMHEIYLPVGLSWGDICNIIIIWCIFGGFD